MAFVEEQSREKTTIIQKYLSKITCNKKKIKKKENVTPYQILYNKWKHILILETKINHIVNIKKSE